MVTSAMRKGDRCVRSVQTLCFFSSNLIYYCLNILLSASTCGFQKHLDTEARRRQGSSQQRNASSSTVLTPSG